MFYLVTRLRRDVWQNKAELIKKAAAEMDFLAAHDPVAQAGFGTFSCKHRDAHHGHSPANGETVDIPASDATVFKAAKMFKDKVN